MRPRAKAVLRANRGKGPDAVMQMVEDRCGGVFDDIETVIPRAELAAHAEKYKRLSGFSVEILNAQAPIIGLLWRKHDPVFRILRAGGPSGQVGG
jgi:hypothetical protein